MSNGGAPAPVATSSAVIRAPGHSRRPALPTSRRLGHAQRCLRTFGHRRSRRMMSGRDLAPGAIRRVVLYPRRGAAGRKRSDAMRRGLGVGGIRVHRRGGTTIARNTTGTRRLARHAIAVSVAALCVGAVFADAADPLGWGSAAPADAGHSLNAVSCPTTGLCVAVDSSGNVVFTTAPTSTAAWTAVSPTVDSGHSLTSVSCASASLCFAADNHGSVFSSATPGTSAAWTSESVDGTTQINGISCPSAGLCVAVDNGGVVRYSTTPGTASSWVTASIDSANHLTAVSCPTASLCAAVDNIGQVFVSTSPATGGWGSALTISSAALTAVSCTSTALCVVTAADGSVHASANASSQTPTWSNTAADTVRLNAVGCSDVGVCVLGDQNGN